jgi:hypothetical protein
MSLTFDLDQQVELRKKIIDDLVLDCLTQFKQLTEQIQMMHLAKDHSSKVIYSIIEKSHNVTTAFFSISKSDLNTFAKPELTNQLTQVHIEFEILLLRAHDSIFKLYRYIQFLKELVSMLKKEMRRGIKTRKEALKALKFIDYIGTVLKRSARCVEIEIEYETNLVLIPESILVSELETTINRVQRQIETISKSLHRSFPKPTKKI